MTDPQPTNTSCIFCQIIAGNAPASFVYQDDLCVAFMDIRPINPGHLLVIPLVHGASLAELEPATGGHMFGVAQQLAAALRQTDLKCEGINFFLADGAAAGQEVFHVHLHVVPRFTGDGFGLKIDPSYWRWPSRGQLDQIAADVRRGL